MPFTPFHFGPSALIALPLNRYLDIPSFVLVNVVVDIEPLIVMLNNLSYPVHGYAHTFLGATLVGIGCGGILNIFKKPLASIMTKGFRLNYQSTFIKFIISGILGAWFHVLLDAPLYSDIKPFYPILTKPLYGSISQKIMYEYCLISFFSALLLYAVIIFWRRKRIKWDV